MQSSCFSSPGDDVCEDGVFDVSDYLDKFSSMVDSDEVPLAFGGGSYDGWAPYEPVGATPVSKPVNAAPMSPPVGATPISNASPKSVLVGLAVAVPESRRGPVQGESPSSPPSDMSGADPVKKKEVPPSTLLGATAQPVDSTLSVTAGGSKPSASAVAKESPKSPGSVSAVDKEIPKPPSSVSAVAKDNSKPPVSVSALTGGGSKPPGPVSAVTAGASRSARSVLGVTAGSSRSKTSPVSGTGTLVSGTGVGSGVVDHNVMTEFVQRYVGEEVKRLTSRIQVMIGNSSTRVYDDIALNYVQSTEMEKILDRRESLLRGKILVDIQNVDQRLTTRMDSLESKIGDLKSVQDQLLSNHNEIKIRLEALEKDVVRNGCFHDELQKVRLAMGHLGDEVSDVQKREFSRVDASVGVLSGELSACNERLSERMGSLEKRFLSIGSTSCATGVGGEGHVITIPGASTSVAADASPVSSLAPGDGVGVALSPHARATDDSLPLACGTIDALGVETSVVGSTLVTSPAVGSDPSAVGHGRGEVLATGSGDWVKSVPTDEMEQLVLYFVNLRRSFCGDEVSFDDMKDTVCRLFNPCFKEAPSDTPENMKSSDQLGVGCFVPDEDDTGEARLSVIRAMVHGTANQKAFFSLNWETIVTASSTFVNDQEVRVVIDRVLCGV